MSNSLESAARSYLAANKGNIPNFDKYMDLMNSPEGKQLLTSLSDKGGDSMKKSAQKAASGDSESAKQLISQMLSSSEGRELAKQVMDIYKGK